MSDNPFAHHTIHIAEQTGGSIWERASAATEQVYEPFTQWHVLVDRLPRLGPILWTYRKSPDVVFPRARMLSRGALLLDHPALAAFAHCVGVTAHGEVNPHGPREWLELRDAERACLARIYLLPDTDYLAWDGLIADCSIQRVATLAPQDHSGNRFVRTAAKDGEWRACTARLPALRLPCLQLLGLRSPITLSATGLQVATTIAGEQLALLRDIAGSRNEET